MLCSICGKNESIVTISFALGNETQSIYICEECMNKFGLSMDKISEFVTSVLEDLQEEEVDKRKDITVFQKLLDTIANSKSSEEEFKAMNFSKETEKKCPVCKSTEKDILSTGHFRCMSCFETFKDKLAKKVSMFNGNVPRAYMLMWLDEKFKHYLKGKLDVAVIKEDFERASQIKKIIDRISK